MAANNQDIAHLSLGGAPGAPIACKNYNAHIAVPLAKFSSEPRQCARCAAWLRKRENKKAKE